VDLLDDQASRAGRNHRHPLAHKDALYVRSHYDGITVTLHDAPLPDEIAIMLPSPIVDASINASEDCR